MTSDREVNLDDAVLEVLADRSCRLVLRYLGDNSGEVASCGELAEYVAANTRKSPREARIQLHHVVLPKLDEVDLLEHDPRSRTVRHRSSDLTVTVLASIED